MELHLDRLALRVALPEAQARRLVRLIAEHLLATGEPGAPMALDRVRVTVAPRPGESLDATAARIADEIRYALRRSS